MILHPLRSELNFPVGVEHNYDLANIDQSAPRWELPSFLFDVLLLAGADASRYTHSVPAKLLATYPFLFPACRQSMQDIVDALRHGAQGRNIRPVPSNSDGDRHSGEHFALLNPSFYDTMLRAHMSNFALEWVLHKIAAFEKSHVQGVAALGQQDAVDMIRPIMLNFILGLTQLSDPEKSSLRRLGPTSVMLLTLAKQWVTVYLPHCCSLFNRVHYGLLQTQDIQRLERQGVDPKRIPGSRFRNAVPFVGKDCPSRASEFAQPDICAGLTILSFQYEGLRRTDLHCVVQVPRPIILFFFQYYVLFYLCRHFKIWPDQKLGQ
jgi:hypothetical protein